MSLWKGGGPSASTMVSPNLPMPAREPQRDRSARPALSPPIPVASVRSLPTVGDTTPPAPLLEPRAAALSLIPHGTFVLTAAYAETRGGVIARWVQQVSSNPPLVVVAIEKGQPLSPVIRDARRFALCQLAPDDRVLRRLFEGERVDPIDPFLGMPTQTAPGGPPVPLKAMAWLDCELTRHLDVEGNCELYIGQVHAGGVLHTPPAPTTAIPGRDEPAPAPRGESRPAPNGHVRSPTGKRRPAR